MMVMVLMMMMMMIHVNEIIPNGFRQNVGIVFVHALIRITEFSQRQGSIQKVLTRLLVVCQQQRRQRELQLQLQCQQQQRSQYSCCCQSQKVNVKFNVSRCTHAQPNRLEFKPSRKHAQTDTQFCRLSLTRSLLSPSYLASLYSLVAVKQV